MFMRFPGIALFVRVASWLAWVGAAGAALGGLVTLIGGLANGSGGFGLVSAFLIWISGLFWFISLKVLPEVLSLLVALHDHVATLAGRPPGPPPGP